ncbi:MAG: hypothetical protein QM541_14470 [Flavobacterium sp.]|nr:hypothetical protein [Flavobacterium sp.]
MKPYYTIIKIAPNNLSGDTLSIGLLLHDGKKFILRFSYERKTLVKKILGANEAVIDFIVKQIEQKISEVNSEILSNSPLLFNSNSFLKGEYFDYLSNYSNGILRFSNATFLNDDIDEKKFDNLYRLLIDKSSNVKLSIFDDTDEMFKAKIATRLISRVANKVHTNLELKPSQLPGLYFNFNIDCIGRNGALIGAKAIFFNKKAETIDKEIGHYSFFISVLSSLYPPTNGLNKFFIIGDEPSSIESREHKIWELIYKNPTITLINSEQLDDIASIIEEKKATSFLEI